MAVSQEEFRKALGHFATGVTLITVARGPAQVHGMTVNAFASVSLDPALVLICVDRTARTYPLLLAGERFGVNVLREEQGEVARYYADVSQDHETPVHLGVRYSFTQRGTPLLEPCLAQLECRRVATHEAGDHTIFIGAVEQAGIGEGRPLLFYRGQLRQLEAGSSAGREKG